jgi:uncharacterized repeat protein (TIGR03803 family)
MGNFIEQLKSQWDVAASKLSALRLVGLLAILSIGYGAVASEYTLQVLHPFLSPGPGFPASGVLQTSDGSLYGTTSQGDSLEGGNGSGTIYRITPDGQISVLYVFDGTLGYYAAAGLVQGNDGNFYGAPRTGAGGTIQSFYRITSGGNITNFCSLYSATNGFQVDYAMILANDGNFYGTTTYGGAGYSEENDAYDGGTVFKLTADGNYTVINSFVGTNGFEPVGRLMQAKNGYIYGATSSGGLYGNGTVFCISTNGEFQMVYSFANTADFTPQGGLVEARDGWLYGMAADNDNDGAGLIYKVSTNGDFVQVAQLDASCGQYPVGSLVMGDDCKLYGVAELGGTYNGGTAFRMATNGQIEVIVSFNEDTGMWPTELSRGIDGNFYGTTSVQGGSYCDGTVFRLVQVPELAMNSSSNAVVGLAWNAFTNGVYQVEYKTSITDADWIPLNEPITATANLVSISDTPSSFSRFYRISVLPWAE